MSEIGFVAEIHIAQFWRKRLGEYEYVNHNEVDLRRWYLAMELRGPEDIRDYLNERTGRYPMGPVTGIVATAPHPSREIVQIWLDSHAKVHSGRYLAATAAFLLFVWFFFTNLAGFERLKPVNQLQMHPPQIGALPANGSPTGPGAPPPTAMLPQTLPSPANAASSSSASGQQGQSSH